MVILNSRGRYFPLKHRLVNILVRGNRSSGKSETDSPEHWKPPNVSLLA